MSYAILVKLFCRRPVPTPQLPRGVPPGESKGRDDVKCETGGIAEDVLGHPAVDEDVTEHEHKRDDQHADDNDLEQHSAERLTMCADLPSFCVRLFCSVKPFLACLSQPLAFVIALSFRGFKSLLAAIEELRVSLKITSRFAPLVCQAQFFQTIFQGQSSADRQSDSGECDKQVC